MYTVRAYQEGEEVQRPTSGKYETIELAASAYWVIVKEFVKNFRIFYIDITFERGGETEIVALFQLTGDE